MDLVSFSHSGGTSSTPKRLTLSKELECVLTYDTSFLLRVQNTLAIYAFLQIRLRRLTQLIVLHRDFSHELEVLFKLVAVLLVVVVKLHPRDTWLGSRADTERGHPSVVKIQRADWEEIQEKPVRRLVRVGDMLRVVAVVVYRVECWWIEDRERPVRVLAVQALLITIHPYTYVS